MLTGDGPARAQGSWAHIAGRFGGEDESDMGYKTPSPVSIPALPSNLSISNHTLRSPFFIPAMASKSIPKITLHWLETSRAQRMLWILEELELPYTVVSYRRENGFAPASMKAIHPLGKSPVVTIDYPAHYNQPEKRVTLAESGFTAAYLGREFGAEKGLWGKGGPDEEYWSHYAEGSLMPFNWLTITLTKLAEKTPFPVRPLLNFAFGKLNEFYVHPTALANRDFIGQTLKEKGGYLTGKEFSVVDALVAWTADLARNRLKWGDSKEVDEWIARCKARDAFKRAMAKEKELYGGLEKAL